MIIKISDKIQGNYGYYEGQTVFLNGNCHEVYIISRFARNPLGHYMASVRKPKNGQSLNFSRASALYIKNFQATLGD